MQYRTISNTNLEVSTICLGTMNWGQQNGEEEAHAQLDMAMERGVNFIDTAEIYPIPPEPEKQGLTEQYIGNWLAKRGQRDDLVIATKVAGPNNTIATREGPFHLDRANIRAAAEGSLQRLQTDYIDLYQVHWPERRTNNFGRRGFTDVVDDGEATIHETLSALSELVEEGKVRYIGLSNETPWGIYQYLRLAHEHGLERAVTIQNQYSLLNREFEVGLSEFAIREGVELLAYSPLSAGVLSGKYLDGARPEGSRFQLFERNAARFNNDQVQPAVYEYVSIANEAGLDPAQMALAYVNMRSFVAGNIIGATSTEQLARDIDSIDVALSADVLEAIEDVHQRMPNPHA